MIDARHHHYLEYLLIKIPFLQKFPTYFIFFAFFGGIATLADWSIFYFTHLRLGWHYIVSVTLSFVFGSLISFLGNKYLNFQDPSKKVLQQYLLFVSLALVGLLITYGLLFIFIERFRLHPMIARVLSTAIMLFYNYFSQKHITFKQQMTHNPSSLPLP